MKLSVRKCDHIICSHRIGISAGFFQVQRAMQPKIDRQKKKRVHIPAIQGTGQTQQIPHLLV